VYENRVLRKILWLKEEEVTRDWRKLHSESNDEMCKECGTCGWERRDA